MDLLLKKMEEYAKEYRVPIINENGKRVLVSVIGEKKPKKVLEIGTAIGYSALLIAQHSDPEIKILSLELDEQRAEVASSFLSESSYEDKIEIRQGDAAQILNTLTDFYDVIFIDAAKGQYPYLSLIHI